MNHFKAVAERLGHNNVYEFKAHDMLHFTLYSTIFLFGVLHINRVRDGVQEADDT